MKAKSREKDYDWAIDLQCALCNDIWTICTICSNARVAMRNDNTLYQHNHRYHRDDKGQNKLSHIEYCQQEKMILMTMLTVLDALIVSQMML